MDVLAAFLFRKEKKPEPFVLKDCWAHDLSVFAHLHNVGVSDLWVRRIGGKQVNRTLRPGADLERVREGIKNYHGLRQLFSELVEQDEAGVLAAERAAEGKKNFKRRLPRR